MADENYELLFLPNRRFVKAKCPKCNEFAVHERQHVDPGFSYAENVEGEAVVCPYCETKAAFSKKYIYGFVKN